MNDPITEEWIYSGDGSEWFIVTVTNTVIADSIPFGAVAQHIVETHNKALKENK